MRKIENTSLREKIALEIKNAILSGEIKAGTILTQEKIAEDLGVSRMPVREASNPLKTGLNASFLVFAQCGNISKSMWKHQTML